MVSIFILLVFSLSISRSFCKNLCFYSSIWRWCSDSFSCIAILASSSSCSRSLSSSYRCWRVNASCYSCWRRSSRWDYIYIFSRSIRSFSACCLLSAISFSCSNLAASSFNFWSMAALYSSSCFYCCISRSLCSFSWPAITPVSTSLKAISQSTAC